MTIPKALLWLKAHVNHDGPDCLIWPFSRNAPHGYAQVGINRKIHKAHRVMCEIVNGPPPTPQHHAAHSCGNGHLGCVHPKHVSWKTASENQKDSIAHGTHFKHVGPRARLTREKVSEIKALRRFLTIYELAAMYGVSAPTIAKIDRGEIWRHVA